MRKTLLIVRLPYGTSNDVIEVLEKALSELDEDFRFIIMHDEMVDRIEFEYPFNSSLDVEKLLTVIDKSKLEN